MDRGSEAGGGQVQELERALTLAPRGQRADWVTRVQIHDSVVRAPCCEGGREGERGREGGREGGRERTREREGGREGGRKCDTRAGEPAVLGGAGRQGGHGAGDATGPAGAPGRPGGLLLWLRPAVGPPPRPRHGGCVCVCVGGWVGGCLCVCVEFPAGLPHSRGSAASHRPAGSIPGCRRWVELALEAGFTFEAIDPSSLQRV